MAKAGRSWPCICVIQNVVGVQSARPNVGRIADSTTRIMSDSKQNLAIFKHTAYVQRGHRKSQKDKIHDKLIVYALKQAWFS